MQVPQAILGRRLHQLNDTMIPQVLVRWSYLPPELSTWEDEEPLRQLFPQAPAWGQAGSKGGRDVTGNTSSSSTPTEKAKADQAGRPKRSKKPNSKTVGPNWTT
jgi:hypothetical protein